MQIASIGDNLHEMLKPTLLEKIEKYYQFVTSWICPESGKS